MVNTGEVENYPGFKSISGADLALEMFNHAVSLGVDFMFDDVLSVTDGHIKQVFTASEKLKAKTIIIATGASPRRLGLANEDRLASKSISWCAICDGPFYKGKDVVVVGGGNSATEEANFLATIATSVNVVQNLDKLTADKKTIDSLLAKQNVTIHYNSVVTEFVVDEAGDLTGVQIKNTLGEKTIIKTDGVFEYIGLKPATEIFKDLNIIDSYGYILTNEKMETALKGIYAVGDVRSKQIRQISTAINDGAIASQNALKYVEENY